MFKKIINMLKNIHLSYKFKLFLFISIEMIAIVVVFLLILFAGKKKYTVTFYLDGGELLGGDLVQTVTRGQSATPPSVTKDGCYLLKWSDSYTKVTRDVHTTAIWEYETTAGIEYEVLENSNYCLISGCYKELSGSVYIGAYYNGLKVLGIKEEAFKDCTKVTSIHLLDGMYSIGKNAFLNCTSLVSIDIPRTIEKIGENAFENCTSLESIEIPKNVKEIDKNAFKNCVKLETVTFAEGVEKIGSNAFVSCEKLIEVTIPSTVVEMGSEVFGHDLTINVFFKENETPENFDENWYSGNPTIVYDYQSVLDSLQPDDTLEEDKK